MKYLAIIKGKLCFRARQKRCDERSLEMTMLLHIHNFTQVGPTFSQFLTFLIDQMDQKLAMEEFNHLINASLKQRIMHRQKIQPIKARRLVFKRPDKPMG